MRGGHAPPTLRGHTPPRAPVRVAMVAASPDSFFEAQNPAKIHDPAGSGGTRNVMKCIGRVAKAILFLPLTPFQAVFSRKAEVMTVATEPMLFNALPPARQPLQPPSRAQLLAATASPRKPLRAELRSAAPPTPVKHAASPPPQSAMAKKRVLPPPSPATPSTVSSIWSPSREQQAKRRTMILSLVKSDTERLFYQLSRAMPRGSTDDSLEQSLRELQRRSPLLQWHVNNNVVPADMMRLLPPVNADQMMALAIEAAKGNPAPPAKVLAGPRGDGLPRSRMPVAAMAAAGTAGEKPKGQVFDAEVGMISKGPELKDALLEVSPSFFALVAKAAKRQPSRTVHLYRRVASALVTLGWWNMGRTWGAGPQRQYPLMNGFLEKIVSIVGESEGIIECDGDEGCVVDAVETQKMQMHREVKRAAVRPSMTRSRTNPKKPTR